MGFSPFSRFRGLLGVWHVRGVRVLDRRSTLCHRGWFLSDGRLGSSEVINTRRVIAVCAGIHSKSHPPAVRIRVEFLHSTYNACRYSAVDLAQTAFPITLSPRLKA